MIRTNISLALLAIAPYIGQHGQPRLKLTYTAPVAAEIIVQVQSGTNTFKDYMLTIARSGTNSVSFDQPANTWANYRLRVK